MDRLDYYDILPKGMEAYLSCHGRHFSKPMLKWAVSMMHSEKTDKIDIPEKSDFDEIMDSYGIRIVRSEGYYDCIYVWCMATSDYLKSSIPDEQHLAMYVKDYIDDVDGNRTRAFDEFYINCIAKGVDIPWLDLV